MGGDCPSPIRLGEKPRLSLREHGGENAGEGARATLT